MKRSILVAAGAVVLAGAFVWGVAVGKYQAFPWNVIKPVGATVLASIRAVLAPPAAERPAEPETSVVTTALVNFDLTIVNDAEPIEGYAGGLSVTEHGILIGRRTDGVLEDFSIADGKLVELPYRLPPVFGSDEAPERFDSGRSIRADVRRYHDIELVHFADGPHLFVTHNYYDPGKVCFGVQIEEAKLPPDWETQAPPAEVLSWHTLRKTVPCVPPGVDRNTFGGFQAGGRIVQASDGSVLVSTGDLEFDGIGRKPLLVSQMDDAASDLGRVLRFDADGAMTVISRGHRNPQGLTFDNQGRLWSVEHGPQGGDELNLVEAGKNYGWPIVTFGTMYSEPESDAKAWPRNPRQGRHDGYEPPRFSWVPSVAPSSIAPIEGVSPRWDGDLLVSTLAGEGLRRLRLAGDHVVYEEAISLGHRIRDIAITGGRIYILFDDGRFGYLTPHQMLDDIPALSDTSTALADAGCFDCHGNPTRPRLSAVADHDIASQPGIEYSEALRRVEGTWTRENLAKFLVSPRDFAPGTEMPQTNLGPTQIEAILNELHALAHEDE